MTPKTASLHAQLKLSFARMLKVDLDRGPDFIANFNCARADGSTTSLTGPLGGLF